MHANKSQRNYMDKIVGYMRKMRQPVYLGSLAVEFGLSLNKTTLMVDILESEGVVRQLTVNELRSAGLEETSLAYELTKSET